MFLIVCVAGDASKLQQSTEVTDVISLGEGVFSHAAFRSMGLWYRAKMAPDIAYSKASSKCGPWTRIEAPVSLGNLSAMHILRPHPRLTELEFLEMGPQNLFNKASGDSNAHSSSTTSSL